MFVTLEGVDGSGKSTQAASLAERLALDGRDVVLTREPGGTALGEAIRDLLLHGADMTAWAEAALYAASRAQHVAELIRPSLARGATVVCDRYLDSSVVYQGAGRGLGVDRVLDLNLAVVDGLVPDLTVLLLVDPETAVERIGGTRDRIEREGGAFLARVQEAYLELAGRFPERYVTVDAARRPEAVAEDVHGAVRSRS